MRRLVAALALTAGLLLGSTAAALANPEAPTNGGSANGGGSSGQCVGANADPSLREARDQALGVYHEVRLIDTTVDAITEGAAT